MHGHSQLIAVEPELSSDVVGVPSTAAEISYITAEISQLLRNPGVS
jgi:hypothetical protein